MQGHTRKDDIVEFARGNVAYRVEKNGYVADVLVGIRKNGAAVLYDLVNIYSKKITEAPVTMASDESSQRRQDASATDIIAHSTEKSTETEKKVSTDGKVVQMSLAEGANQQAAGDIDALIKSAGIEGEATEIRENLAELYRVAAEADADERMVARSAKTLAMSMVSEGALRDGETRDEAVARLQKEILSRTEFAEKEGARPHFFNYTSNYTKLPIL